MDSLVGYGSDDDNETERYEGHYSSVAHGGGILRRRDERRDDDGTNYDDVNMDMSEDSQAESEPELPPAETAQPRHSYREERRHSVGRQENRESERRRDDRDKRRDNDRDRRERPDNDRDRRERPDIDRDRRERPDDRYARGDRERDRRYESGSSRRGLLGDRPGDKLDDSSDKVPSLMELNVPAPSSASSTYSTKSQDARDAVSPRFVDRGRRDREKERDRDRHGRRSEEKRSKYSERRSRSRERDRSKSRGLYPPPDSHAPRTGSKYSERQSRSRERDRSKSRGLYPPPDSHAPRTGCDSSSERRGSPPPRDGDYRPTSYKVNKKLQVMEKMGLQIKTPDGSMATAQQLRQAAHDAPAAQSSGLPSYYNPSAVNTNKILDQVNKRKLLWSNKNKREAEEAAKWSGTRFANDDGKQVSKFMRLMGIKEPGAVQQEAPDKTVDPIKKQEELFQAMQQQYEVARATTHTMRGVGLGFQRGQY